MKIAMIASEANPYVKTGGLADVTYSLSKELTLKGEEVSIFIPLYRSFREKIINDIKLVKRVNIDMAWRKNSANVYYGLKDGISYYFIENAQYFERDGIYGYDDDGERFAFFVLACYEAMKEVKFKPNIVHVHDWQTSMFPCVAKEKNEAFYSKCKYVLTIHNPAFQGLLFKEALGDLFNLSLDIFYNGKARFKNMVSTLKCGIMYADKIVAVSPTHRGELLSYEGGMGLNDVLRLREYDFVGILNGIDYSEFNPTNDPYLPALSSKKKVAYSTFKKELKKALFEEYGIEDDGKPLFTMVSRLTWQKGIDILLPVIDELANRNCAIFILGSGESRYEYAIQSLRDRYSKNVAVYIGYSNSLAHRLYACSDFFLMPSLFEPCGLGQMIAERYGTLPIVRRVGGLRDSVNPFYGDNADSANGFGFDDYSVSALSDTCDWAINVYANKKLIFKKLVKNALETDNSWAKSGAEYLDLYKSILG